MTDRHDAILETLLHKMCTAECDTCREAISQALRQSREDALDEVLAAVNKLWDGAIEANVALLVIDLEAAIYALKAKPVEPEKP